MNHNAILDSIKVRYKCNTVTECDGWEGSKNPFTPCAHSTMVLLDEEDKATRYCLRPPSPSCPTSPYVRQSLPLWAIERDFDVLAEQIKWHVDEYGEVGREKDDILILLDEVTRRAKELAVKTVENEKDHGGNNPWK